MTSNHRILIIDDDPGIREAYRSILQPAEKSDVLAIGARLFGEGPTVQTESAINYDITITQRGDQGIAAVEAAQHAGRPFAVAFIDMMMPGIDGAETARRIWELDSRIKIAIVTAYSDHTPADIIRVTGRNDLFYLRKPFNPEEIRQLARALTHSWDLEQERQTLSQRLQEANAQLADMNRNLENKVKEQTAMLVQSEKMASIGILAAGIAHEINNPISYINGNLSVLKQYGEKLAELLARYQAVEDQCMATGIADLSAKMEDIGQFKAEESVDFILEDINALVDESLEGVDRVRRIVMDLKTFSRLDEADFDLFDVNQCLESTLNIIWNEIKYQAKVVKVYGELPEIMGYPRKISQVFMNVLINAAKAIHEQGEIRISTRHVINGRRSTDASIVVSIADTGVGIPASAMGRIFDPFFTTKPVGEGTGLGLSISYDIVKAHGGEITVDSQEGQGTTVTITLPVTSPHAAGRCMTTTGADGDRLAGKKN
ncbi:conserved hypothetical protein [Desulfosarcina cetonica]|uniref:hybrid sensor histidine kinase/response regulator n=1 Tax=Desulfosarcina cetonica TaxID=90730 RepID=UPI0006D073FC|nr:ATP-binding protein [Desulfosarcina cetonica]VTR65760.1 conserved hypothetical protein [Desulfosarcina cetonica]